MERRVGRPKDKKQHRPRLEGKREAGVTSCSVPHFAASGPVSNSRLLCAICLKELWDRLAKLSLSTVEGNCALERAVSCPGMQGLQTAAPEPSSLILRKPISSNTSHQNPTAAWALQEGVPAPGLLPAELGLF